jgi:hypothetical protein
MGIDDESSHPELCSEVAGGALRLFSTLLPITLKTPQ